VAEAADEALLDAIRQTPLHQLFDPTGVHAPGAVALAAAHAVLTDTLRAWGLQIVSWQLGALAPTAAVQEHLTAVWRGRLAQRELSPDSLPPISAIARATALPKPETTALATADELLEPEIPALATAKALPEPEIPATAATVSATPPAATTAGPAASRLAEEIAATQRAATTSATPATTQPTLVTAAAPAVARAENAPRDAATSEREALARDLKAAAAAAKDARRGVGPAVGVRASPVSFAQFLTTLRRRAAEGDESADVVLRQVLGAMARLDPETRGEWPNVPAEGGALTTPGASEPAAVPTATAVTERSTAAAPAQSHFDLDVEADK
jgi:hypothetical protein